MSTTTPNLSLTLPTPNVDSGWGGTLNTDFTLIDNLFVADGSGTSVGLQVGAGKTLNAGGTIVAGGTMILGSGDGTASVTAPTIRGAAKTGTNVTGSDLVIDALNGTGTGGSGKFVIRTAAASGTPGTTANTMSSRLEVNSAGALGFAGANYGTANQVLLSGGSTAVSNWGNVDGSVINFASQAQGDVLYRGASAWERLPAGTSGQLLKTNGAAANPAWIDSVSRASSQSIATSGASFTDIPAWARTITISIDGLNSAQTSLVRLGTSGGYVSTGYASSSSFLLSDSGGGGNANTTTSTVGMCIYPANVVVYGSVRLVNITGNTWVSDHTFGSSNSYTVFGGGRIALSGVLDRVQLVPTTGSFTAAGTINILYS